MPKLKILSEISKLNPWKKNGNGTFDQLISNPGFQDLVVQILQNLDSQDLVKCRLVSKRLQEIIDTEKVLILIQIKFIDDKPEQFFIRKRNEKSFQIFKRFKPFELQQILKFMIEPTGPVNLDIFHNACYSNRNDIAEFFLNNFTVEEVKSTILNLSLYPGTSNILHKCCLMGCFETLKMVLEYLINNNMDFTNRQDDFGKTPLHYACHARNLDIVKLLLDCFNKTKESININAIDWTGETAFHMAIHRDDLEIAQAIFSYSQRNSEKLVTSLMDRNRQTPFHTACYSGSLETVEFLLENTDVELEALDIDRRTPFHLACENGRIETVKAIFNFASENGRFINLSLKDNKGRTPFQLACYSGNTEIVKNVLKFAIESNQIIDFNKRDNEGRTSIEAACFKEHRDLVFFLLQYEETLKLLRHR